MERNRMGQEINNENLYILGGEKPKPLLEGKTPVQIVAAGGVDDCCKQFGKWSCYKDSISKYKIYAERKE